MFKRFLSGDSLRAKSLRSTGLSFIAFGGDNILRLASNLVLTRILFPEAFGLMALVGVFITGLRMFSDTGILQSVIQNPRGDEPEFLDTAWTMQVIRGFLLWLMTCLIAWPAAQLYDAPELAQILPVAGLSLIIAGFMTTKAMSNNRHMALGRQTVSTLVVKTIEIGITVWLAWQLESVWALVYGSLIGTGLTLLSNRYYLVGHNNWFHWDPDIARTLFNFGKFIFLSTAVTFVTKQGDKVILGAFMSLGDLGVYNIGYFLGTIPLILYQLIMGRVVFPMYRLKPIKDNPRNRKQIFFARRIVILGGILGTVLMAAFGIALVNLLYDPRYAMAGPVVVLLNLAMVPQIVLSSYGASLMSAGDSKQIFYLSASTAVVQVILMFFGVQWLGIFGVIMASGIALLITYPFRIRAIRAYKTWDPWADIILLGAGFGINGAIVWWYWDAIAQLL